MPASPLPNVVFDLGGVLIDWNPRYVYSKLIPDASEMERFLAEVCTREWIEKQDAGRTFAEGVEELSERFPEHADLIRAFDERWEEMLGGPIQENVDLLHHLDRRGVPLYALSNWPLEKFVYARERFPFLSLMRGIVISGAEGVIKPDPRIFQILLSRYHLTAADTIFIDDVEANVAAARTQGLQALHAGGGTQLSQLLERLVRA